MDQQDHNRTRVLALDTSTSALTAALLEGGALVDERHSQAERNHSIKLLPTLQSLMADNGWSGKSTDLVAVGVGPGSYTGVRIAVTAGKTMAWAWDKPVIGVSSLEALALSGLQQAEQDGAAAGRVGRILVYPLMDARRGQVYTAPFACNGSGAEALTDGVERHGDDGIRLFSLVAEEASRALEADADAEGADHPHAAAAVWFVGDTGAQQEALDGLQTQWGERIRVIPCGMEARWIGRLGLRAYAAGRRTDTHRLEPNYTQLAEAEAKLLAKERADRRQQ
ncbi:tRNA (adenosine(37)-N6)-threonylcarbamoyltransferase complex dimerization subunit type 1 TsaB [Paenibacillus melissococcoides]|uniref:tRNA (Adenosine(37)-N6)-threonylcarbamoyltransferase complex dimerization subunit type 1 TsaB n=1 Tax=Paenibacillus melissococcoides TaxID=2912268 RepID=A0ABM9GCD5_9BACL|nr:MULTISPECIES: tRNA (adenosine(37)-N6)-threonylcarbamoyltransferase complex dimerization subunit type 1 TsaB [Paenibacillus]MEB9895783.1 tRNA (adenosine(37)-N6)-threonylcarbamoyltransferase complex dimerization subunit type 1 TsaB [Bacillus cereus]CAH8249420.1 tRNA (adenosine(37)-N6)-threonylcarbamoyltransferase complex dimerization subunit type 1 TsaB [Paenibacillus melissococcoides]CAH8721146.1 tRNA (adenosine(37)-N6)-threonylcarbamoyltransferase complex dimerization subunit type 1 TsaB [Pae